jgi:hypothetical protein
MPKTAWFPVDGWPGLVARNPIRVEGDVAYLSLGGQGQHTMCIGREDVPLYAPHRWTVIYPNGPEKTPYAKGTVAGRHNVRAHHLILAPGPGQMVDHKNGDGLDNRRENLRLVTRSQNAQNMRGVRKDNRSGVRNVTITTVSGITYYWVRVKRDGRTVGQKHFPYTPEGLVLANAHARELRERHLTHTDGR